MGVQHCVITLDNQWNTYYPGQTVNGTAVFNLDKPKKIRGICIKFKGVAEVKWSSTDTRRDNNGKTHNITIDHTADEEYFSINYYLLGSKTGNEIELPPGTHTYPFTCALPPTLPSSFEGQHGFVRYTVKVTLDRPWKFDEETKMAFTVTSHLDLNSSPEYRAPIHFQLEKTFCCCWCKSGPLTLDVRLPVSGYCCGQTIPMDINCENTSGVEVDDIVIKLNKLVTYRAKFPTSKTKEEAICISETKLGSVNGHEAKNFQELLEIPPLPPSNLVNCSIIDLTYNIEVVCNVSGLHMDMEDTKVITLGTVPLIGFQPPPPKGQENNMLPSVPVPSSETPLLTCQVQQNANQAYPTQQYPQPNMYPSSPQMAPYPTQISPNAYPGVNPNGNMGPSAPMMENQPPLYPGMAQPIFKESQFSASNIQDSSDNQHMQVSGNQVFAPRYPTYGFVMP